MGEKAEQFLLLARSARGRAACDLVVRCTSEPGLFTFGELLEAPSIADLKKGEHEAHHRLLELFAFGTYSDYKAHAATLPALNDAQTLKLKQLTVASLATRNKVLAYDLLREQLEIPTVRELEDFIITDCCYSGIVQGKLDQRARCLLVQDFLGRDVRAAELAELQGKLSAWVAGSEQLLGAIEDRINFAIAKGEEMKQRRAELEAKREEMQSNVKTELELRGSDAMMLDEGGGSFDMMEEERVDRVDRIERSERMVSRPKSRRR